MITGVEVPLIRVVDFWLSVCGMCAKKVRHAKPCPMCPRPDMVA